MIAREPEDFRGEVAEPTETTGHLSMFWMMVVGVIGIVVGWWMR